MKKILGLTFLLSVFAFSLGNAQVEVNDTTFPLNATIEGKKVILNGAGVRKKAFFDLYTAGLYTQKKSKDGNAIANSKDPMAVRLIITSKMINTDNMSEAIIKGVKKGAGSAYTSIKSRTEKMAEVFKTSGIKVGDRFDIKYSEGVTKIYKNDELKNSIKGYDFKKALFNMWLGDNPVDSKLKQSMLGN